MVSVNILNYNTYERSKVCIDSCLKQKDIDFRILLIDNASTDDSLTKLKSLYGSRIDYLQTGENYGFAKGNNIGVQNCLDKGYKYSLLLNSDTELIGENILKSLDNIMGQYPNCKVLVPDIYDVTKNGRVLHDNDSTYLKYLRSLKILPTNFKISDNLFTISEAHGSALFVDNKECLKVGGFPWHFFMYGEEGLFSKNILWTGNLIYYWSDVDNFILHHHDKSGKVDPWRLYLMGRNRILEFFDNNQKKKAKWMLVLILFYFKIIFSRSMTDRIHYWKGMNGGFSLYLKNATKNNCYENGRVIRNTYK